MNREHRISDPSLIANNSSQVEPKLYPYSPAFPTQAGSMVGLSAREYFAAIAMQAILSSLKFEADDPDKVAADAVTAADALIEALNN